MSIADQVKEPGATRSNTAVPAVVYPVTPRDNDNTPPNRGPWPAWHPGEELTADALVALEKYLLERSAAIDGGAHGVDAFDWITSLKVYPSETALALEVHELRGVTLSGHPVFISSAGSGALSGTIELNGRRAVVADLAIEVNARGDYSKQDEDDPVYPAKLILTLDSIPEEAPVPPLREQVLYLGRFRFAEQVEGWGANMLVRPYVRRLDALRPLDGDPAPWLSWTAPLREHFASLLSQVHASDMRSPIRSIFHAEVVRLAYDWRYLAIPAIEQSFAKLNWLRAMAVDRRASPDAFPPQKLPPPSDASGDLLPQQLLSLLKTPAAAWRRLSSPEDYTLESRPTTLIATFHKELAEGQLEMRLPTGLASAIPLTFFAREGAVAESVSGEQDGLLSTYPIPLLPRHNDAFAFVGVPEILNGQPPEFWHRENISV